MKATIHTGDVLTVLRGMESESVHCVVTSPPYWGLRDYGIEGQIGMEPTLDAYVQKMMEVFREVRRVLRSDGTLWLNLGDSYNGGAGGRGDSGRQFHEHGEGGGASTKHDGKRIPRKPTDGLKPKDLCMVPARVALALQADGWWLRSEIIWAKGNPMPESVTDRPTSAHEKIYLLSKSERYWYDADAVREKALQPRGVATLTAQHKRGVLQELQSSTLGTNQGKSEKNLRNVWTINSEPYPAAHFATFPTMIPKRCIMAGCPADGVVLDPFAGSGTTLAVAVSLGRRAVGIELNPCYVELIEERIAPAVAQELLPL